MGFDYLCRGQVVFTLRTDRGVTGGLKFRRMTLSFSPTACFSSVAATDVYQEINDVDPEIKSIYYNLTIYTPPTLMGAPVRSTEHHRRAFRFCPDEVSPFPGIMSEGISLKALEHTPH